MKKYATYALALFTAALLAPAALIGATPDSKGIPADASSIIFIDVASTLNTKIGTALKDKFDQYVASDKGKTDFEKFEEFKNQTGIDPFKDLDTLVVGVFKEEDSDEKPQAVMIARGRFSPSKIVAFAKKNDGTTTEKNGIPIIEYQGLAKDEEEEDNADSPVTVLAEKSSLRMAAIVDSKTILFTETPELLDQALAALSGKADSYALPSNFGGTISQGVTTMAAVYVSRKMTPESGEDNPSPLQIPKAEFINIVLGESSTNLIANVGATYGSPEDALKMQGSLQMVLGFLQMGAINAASSDKPGAAESAQRMQTLLSSLRFNTINNDLVISIEYPADEVAKEIKNYTPKSRNEEEMVEVEVEEDAEESDGSVAQAQ